jgi:hypothetical protein
VLNKFNQDVHLWEHESIADFWRTHVPTYKSKSIRPFFARFPFEGLEGYAKAIRAVSAKRSDNRIRNYVDSSEMLRVRQRLHGGSSQFSKGVRSGMSVRDGEIKSKKRNGAKDVSIRFGVSKTGHGYSGERGDFCLVSAVYSGNTLAFFYRSIELIGGFAFDTVLVDHVCKELGIKPKFIEIWATKAFVFALKGNSNEKLYPKLKRIFRTKEGPKAKPLTFDGNYDG